MAMMTPMTVPSSSASNVISSVLPRPVVIKSASGCPV